MSWFDTTKGLAGLAKTALKEAQKQIDKALDIQEQNSAASSSAEATNGEAMGKQTKKLPLPGGANREKSKTEPSTPAGGIGAGELIAGDLAATSNWGSFTGSFFDNPNAHEMVTTPPKASLNAGELTAIVPMLGSPESTMGVKRPSMTSNSDSVELLSSPISPSSEVTSPSEAAGPKSTSATSPSVELLLSATPTNEMESPESGASLPESIVIIASHETGEEDEEEDSMSYNTVMDDTLTQVAAMSKQYSSASEESKDMSFDADATFRPSAALAVSSTSTSSGTIKMFASLDETQTMDSDSTQSFECIQMQTSGIGTSAGTGGAEVKESPDGHSHDSHEAATKSSSLAYSSPPHSNDEMETTTSSDIEIISNPNGDSSSTNSLTRASPLKLKKSSGSSGQGAATKQSLYHGTGSATKKGHQREPSEISILSEDSQSEVEKLLGRISELNEIIEARELRLLQSERQNASLLDKNNELQAAIDALKGSAPSLDSAEEYTQRLSALEKKFQSSIRERDALRIQIKALKDELQNKIPKGELDKVVGENNAMIAELRQEGEKLSKEILQQSNIIKKLRAKEKSADVTLKRNKEQIADLTEELERVKKTLNAKDDVERTQIEAVHKMSSEKRRLEEENAQLRSKLEDTQQRLATLQTSFDAVKSELHDRNRVHSDLSRSAEEALAARREKEQTRAENQEMMRQLNELREKMRLSEHEMARREQQLREENRQLMRRVEEAELRAESTTQEVSLTTVPLMRQLEALQNTFSQRTNIWQKEEAALLKKLDKAQTQLKALESGETSVKEKADILQKRCIDLEAKLSQSLMTEEQFRLQLHQAKVDLSLKESAMNSKLSQLSEELKASKGRILELEEKVTHLQAELERKCDEKPSAAMQLSVSSIENPLHRELSAAALDEVARLQQQGQQGPTIPVRAVSPSNSLGRNSVDDAMGGSFFDWQTDDFDYISNSGRPGTAFVQGTHINLYEHNTTTLEHLQSLIKQRDGEVKHLLWELTRVGAERNSLRDEVTNITMELETVKEKLLEFEELKKNYGYVKHRYDALLQMYGEKEERTQELELDIVELKEAYKAQIDELLGQSRPKQ